MQEFRLHELLAQAAREFLDIFINVSEKHSRDNYLQFIVVILKKLSYYVKVTKNPGYAFIRDQHFKSDYLF